MSSKKLLGDAISALEEKEARRSSASKRCQPDAHENDGVDHHCPQEDHLSPSGLDLERLPAPRASSTTTSANDRDSSTALPGTLLSADWVDVESPLTPSHNAELQATESHILDLATSSFPPVPEDADLPHLPKPVLIPRLDQGRAAPFARAWAPELAEHAIEKEDFVAFIDNLNIIISPHVAIRVLQVAAFAVGLVPYDVAEGVGGALEAIAILSAVAVNYKRTKDYLLLMNDKYFHPRKLHVKIIGTKRLKKLFKLDKKDPCLAPLTEQTLELTIKERCLQYLSQYICEVSFDVPAPSPATTTLAKIAAWEIRHKIHKADKKAKWGRKRAWKRHQKGKKLQERWEGWGERQWVKSLGWILVQDFEEWEAQKAEKKAKKEEKRRTSTWLPRR
ncbi:hypothetical protein HD806DRAFT_378876 [Xylariaceae sp. AK1471]|nr:hypothetical protein HD806DRAFT_378876 [Xylariaceae sp. AK1471]